MRAYLLVFATLMPLWSYAAGADEKIRTAYMEVGIAASMLLKPAFGYWYDGIGVRFSGMYLDKDHQELDVNIGHVICDSKNLQQTINLLTSWVVGSDPGADYKYAATGIAYGLNYRGFYVELGLAVPWRDDLGNLANNPIIPIGSWGYIYRFN